MHSSIGIPSRALVQQTSQAPNITFLMTKSHNIHAKTKKPQFQRCIKKKVEYKQPKDSRLNTIVMSTSNFTHDIYPSPSDTIVKFYKYINQKDVKKLAKFISADCLFEDLSFFKPFRGRKEVLIFYDQLTKSMGENIEFVTEEVCEGDDTVAVNWHMEWKNYRIPFTRGSSFYELSRDGENYTIRKAQVVIESPIKPGHSVLGLLQIVTSLFDAFPEATEWCLRSPHVILQLLLRIYNLVFGPLITPILAFYTNLANFIAQSVTFTLRILFHIAKSFRK